MTDKPNVMEPVKAALVEMAKQDRNLDKQALHKRHRKCLEYESIARMADMQQAIKAI